MSAYRVELRGDCREVYVVEAESEQEARDNWPTGHLLVTEAEGMEVSSVALEA